MRMTLDLAVTYRQPLLTRIRLRLDLLCATVMFAFDQPLFSQIPSHIASIRYHVTAIVAETPHVAEAIANAKVEGAFNPFIGRRLEGIAPPRPALKDNSDAETFRLLEKVLAGLESGLELQCLDDWLSIEVCSPITELYSLGELLKLQHSQQDRFVKLSCSPEPILPYIRSLHQSIFFSNMTINHRRPLRWLSESFYDQLAGCLPSLWREIALTTDREMQLRIEKVLNKTSRVSAIRLHQTPHRGAEANHKIRSIWSITLLSLERTNRECIASSRTSSRNGTAYSSWLPGLSTTSRVRSPRLDGSSPAYRLHCRLYNLASPCRS